MYLNGTIIARNFTEYDVEPKHRMYLNSNHPLFGGRKGIVEPKHRMYLNGKTVTANKAIGDVEPKHRMYLNKYCL